MKTTLLNIISLFFFSFLLSSCMQDTAEKTLIQVDEPTDIISLQRGYFKAKFSPDGQKLIFTDQSNNGLSVFNLYSKAINKFTRKTDAGLEANFGPDSKQIYFITHDFEEKLRMSNLYVQRLEDGVRTPLAEGVRSLKIVYADPDKILYYQDGELREYDLRNNKWNESISPQTGVFSDAKLNLSVYENGEARVLNPNGPGDYIWPSLSPDKKKVLYTLSGKGSFISDLEGKEIIELGRINAPKWSSDGKYVIGMEDQDDGQRYIQSDVILITADGKKRQNLTKNIDAIALYPAISPDGGTIVFNDDKGMVYTMSVR